jgi:hypothetical protein
MGLARDPVELLVEDADSRLSEDEDEAVVIAMEVGDGHDAIDARPDIGDVGGGGEAEEEDDGQEQEKKTVPGSAFSAAEHLNPLRSISFIADFPEEIKG